MRKKDLKKLLAGMCIACVIATLFSPCPKETHASDIDLKKAGNFHVFANTVQLHAHTNGNIATRYLKDANSGFGTTQLKSEGEKEVSYIQNIGTMISSSWADPLIVGGDVVTESMDNGNAIGVKTKYGMIKLDHIKNVEIDDSYIDFDLEFDYLREVSTGLYEIGTTKGTSLDMTDFNHCTIDVHSKDINVITISAEDFSCMNELEVCGVNTENSTVIINIDMSKAGESFVVNTKTYMTDDTGISYFNAERGSFEESRILWNFYDAEQGIPYAGDLSFQKSWMGTILAPEANITVYSNVDGTIICDSFNSYGETHRWDFNGQLPLSAMQNGSDSTGNNITSPETGNPSQENPSQENPPLENPPLENPPLENPPLENPPLENPTQGNPEMDNTESTGATPTIKAHDRYFTLEDAKCGKITEEELLRNVSAVDEEDGELSIGSGLTIPYYEETDFTGFEDDGDVTVTYIAKDSDNNKSSKTITVHVVNTEPVMDTEMYYIRFINSNYYKEDDSFITAERGGLEKNSIWRTEEYTEKLEKVLSNKKEGTESTSFKYLWFSWEVTKPGTGTWDYKKCTWHFTKSEIDTAKDFILTNGYGKYKKETAIHNFCQIFSNNQSNY